MAPNKKGKRSKVELVFDSKEREDFLTGFSKRKQARKNAARADIERKFKEEVARIKKEKRDSIKRRLDEVSSVRRSAGIELTQLVQNENEFDKREVLDLPQHMVTITSTEELDLTKSRDDAFLGSNTATAVEVVDASIDEESDDNGTPDLTVLPGSTESKTAKAKSAAKVSALARKAQMLKTKKKRHKVAHGARMSKSQKKFLKKHHRHKPSR